MLWQVKNIIRFYKKIENLTQNNINKVFYTFHFSKFNVDSRPKWVKSPKQNGFDLSGTDILKTENYLRAIPFKHTVVDLILLSSYLKYGTVFILLNSIVTDWNYIHLIFWGKNTQ